MTLVLRYAVRSDVGLLREGNEDSAYAGPRLLAVADGMGGHAAGEVASSVTIASMAKLDSEPPGGDMLEELSSAVTAANARLQEMIIANPAVEGMGTTLTALFWSDGQAAVCHIGDSRGYLLRDGELYQITHDHTLVQSLVDEGRISADDVSTHPQRSLLLRALDGRSIAEPDLSVHEAQAGDRYLLCSDGLSGVVSDETLRDTLADIEDPEAVTRQLIELALHGGGPDNITCIVADVVDTATSRVPPTGTPVVVGAAANAGQPILSTDGSSPGLPGSQVTSFGMVADLEDHLGGYDDHEPSTASPLGAVDDLDPLAVASENGTGPNHARGRRGHRGQPKRSRRSARRRFPIVTASLVVLLAVIVGGGVIGWIVLQNQGYLAVDSSNNVVIYRGINERIAGFSLSRFYRDTRIPMSQVPDAYRQAIIDGNATGSLASVKQTAASIATAASKCQQEYASLKQWVGTDNAYLRELAQRAKGLTAPGPKPTVDQGCPQPQAFGISAGDLTPTTPTPARSAHPASSAHPATTGRPAASGKP